MIATELPGMRFSLNSAARRRSSSGIEVGTGGGGAARSEEAWNNATPQRRPRSDFMMLVRSNGMAVDDLRRVASGSRCRAGWRTIVRAGKGYVAVVRPRDERG